ncbi:MAG: hypothetical protein ACYSR3_14515 [Planctomycetota bacterium]|jgi:membrane protein involved in colicin uptake
MLRQRSYAEALEDTNSKFQTETKARAEAEEKLSAENLARTRAEEKAAAEAQERAKAEARAEAEAKARAEAEEKLNAERQARSMAEEKATADAGKIVALEDELRAGSDFSTKKRCDCCQKKESPENKLVTTDSGQKFCQDCLEAVRE